jgi:hypothetical protein
MHTRHIAALFRTQRMMGRHNRAKQWTGPPRVRDQTNSSHPSPTRCCRSLLQRARDTHAAYHKFTITPVFSKMHGAGARVRLRACSGGRLRAGGTERSPGSTSPVGPTKLRGSGASTSASATAPGRQPSMAHAAALFYARFRVATGHMAWIGGAVPYSVPPSCVTL